MKTILSLVLLPTIATAFTCPSPTFTRSSSVSLSMSANAASIQSRKGFLKAVGSTSTAAALIAILPQVSLADDEVKTLPNGVTYKVIKTGDGASPVIGELAAIRFAAYAGAIKIDDIFETAEPYYTRVGSGGMIKGVEGALPLMRLGDRWELTVPGSLAFGKKGRPASAGKPRIPADSTIVFDVEMVGIPGREPELIDIIGDV